MAIQTLLEKKHMHVLLLTSQPHVHLGRIILQEHVVQCADGIKEHSVHLRGEQANQVGNSPTAVDHLKTLPRVVWREQGVCEETQAERSIIPKYFTSNRD